MADVVDLEKRFRRIADWITQTGGDNNSQLFDRPLMNQLSDHLQSCGIEYRVFMRSCGIEEIWLEAVRLGSIRRLEAERIAQGLEQLDSRGLADRPIAR